MTTIPNPCSYAPFFYHTSLGKLVLVDTGSNPAYNYQNIATYTFDGSVFALLSTFPTYTTTNTQPPLRTETSCVYDGTNGVLYGGKSIKGDYYNDSWLLSSAGAWTQSAAANTSISTAPQQRAGAYMSQVTGGAFMFGGYDSHMLFSEADAVWNYTEGGGWTSTTLTAIPPLRTKASIAYNGTNQTVLAFGAGINGNTFGDVWSFDNTSWGQLTTSGLTTSSGGPSRRHSVSVTWNGTSFVIFGGVDSNGNYLNDTYLMSTTGAITVPTLTNSPSVRGGHQAAYLPGTGIVIYSGVNGSSYPLRDCWTLAVGGSTWVQVF